MKKLLENTKSVALGMVIGALIGVALITLMYKTSLASVQQSYDKGYRTAQQECRDFLTNTK